MKYCDDDAESKTLSQVSRHADAAIAAALQFAEPPPETVTVASLAPVKKQRSRKNLRVEAALRQGRRTAARKMFSPSFHGKSHTGDALLGRSLKMPFRGANGKVSILDGVVVCALYFLVGHWTCWSMSWVRCYRHLSTLLILRCRRNRPSV